MELCKRDAMRGGLRHRVSSFHHHPPRPIVERRLALYCCDHRTASSRFCGSCRNPLPQKRKAA
ncbi:hypothetical protein PIB30_064239 [Stylosanthes scabra]|uniref:Uncharacterized protein n=1 Tax=Stylosanthes scabra TaxID=79078 RepID=A0ABU6TLF6_9FABA|nr:hypothetical protein [Stylosanthes scabra]